MRLITFLGIVLYGALPRCAFPQTPAQTAPQSQAAPATRNQETDAAAELQKAVTAAGNDHAALVRNLQDYLRRFPDPPQKANVYRAIVNACQEIHDDACLLDYTDRLIAIQPDDTQVAMIAVDVLQKKGDDASLTRALTYVTHVIDRTLNTFAYQRPERLSLRNGRIATRSFFSLSISFAATFRNLSITTTPPSRITNPVSPPAPTPPPPKPSPSSTKCAVKFSPRCSKKFSLSSYPTSA